MSHEPTKVNDAQPSPKGAASAAAAFSQPSKLTLAIAAQADAARDLTKALGPSNTPPPKAPGVRVVRSVGEEGCDQSSKYRTVDGRCNNLAQPHWGAAEALFRRLVLPSSYRDKIDLPRNESWNRDPTTKKPLALPSARLVSTRVHETLSVPDAGHSHLLMQWGQFLDHDVDMTPAARSPTPDGAEPAAPDCSRCPPEGHSVDGVCFPIPVPEDDPVLAPASCLPLTRSADGNTELGQREQLNQISAYVDASNVYGSEEGQAADLRAFQGGRLKENPHGNLPEDPGRPGCKSSAVTNGHNCFKAGDARVNVTPGLISMHALWMRQHNRLAEELARLNPHWDDERLYQEARRIVGAQMQVITYGEFLPLVLGQTLMDEYGLGLSDDFSSYNASCDGGILNEFATAAFRFGHSQIVGHIARRKGLSLTLADHFMDPTPLSGPDALPNIQDILQGMSSQQCEAMDVKMDESIRDRLFADSAATFGLDLAALNVQRGRDHGLPPYEVYRYKFGLSIVKSWEAMAAVVGEETAARMEAVYPHPKDVDLFTGLLAEPHVPGGLVGELCGKIFAEQFRRLKDCDRFFFSHTGQAGSFGKDQLRSLKGTTQGKVMCDNAAEEGDTPAEVFRLSAGQARLDCRPGAALASVDLSHWKD